MNHLKLALLFFTLLIVTACSDTPTENPGTKPKIKIGAIYNLTGSQAPLDVPSSKGALLAVKVINTLGGAGGRQIELVLYDGKTDTAEIARLAYKLINEDSVCAIIGFSDTDMLMPAATIAAQAKILFITSGATSPKLPERIPNYLFLSCFGDNTQAAAAAEYCYNYLNMRSAYLLYDRGMEYTFLLDSYFRKRFTELGGSVVYENSYVGTILDFSEYISKYKQLKPTPDMLFLAVGPDDCRRFLKAFRTAGIDRPIFGGDAYDNRQFIDTALTLSGEAYYTAHAFIDQSNTNPRIHDFIQEFKDEYPSETPDAFAALGYDAVTLLADAIQRAGSTVTDSVRKAIFATNSLPGATGTLSYGPNTYIPVKYVAIMKISGGKLELAKEVLPVKVPLP